MMFTAVILMAGESTRLNLNINKNLYVVNKKPLFMYSVEAFMSIKECEKVILVVHDNDFFEIAKSIKEMNANIKVVNGGKNRQESAYCGVKAATSNIVLIHDAARPLITREDILLVYKDVLKRKASCLATKIHDSMKKINKRGFIKTINRDNFAFSTTPQAVYKDLYVEAYFKAVEAEYIATDDMEIIEKFTTIKPHSVLSNNVNLKLTTKMDLEVIQYYLEVRNEF